MGYRPPDFPGNNTGAFCHFLLQGIFSIHPGINPMSPALQADSLPLSHQGRPNSFPCMHAKSIQSCLTLCDLMDSSLPGSTVHGILQAIILEWAVISSSTGSSQSRDRNLCLTMFPALADRFFITGAPWKDPRQGRSQVIGVFVSQSLRILTRSQFSLSQDSLH